MKKLITLAFIATIGLSSYAQEKPERAEKKEKRERPERRERSERNETHKFTAEQRNQLLLKKMTLELDLNASQQKEMSKIIAEQTAKKEEFFKNRKAKTEKPTSDEIFAMKSKMLDEQIAMKQRMKKTLSSEQFDKWEKIKKQHHEGMKRHFRHRMAQNTHHHDRKFKRHHRPEFKKDSTETMKKSKI
ncbi:MAG TPA: hypothetical protein VJ780_12340 [Flavobacterium sp.]|nr:hypothetical protein [Flavobacterium sp.]